MMLFHNAGRRLTALLLLLCLLFTLGACGEQSAPAETAPTVSFTRDTLPRLDGSTSTAPYARAMAAVLLGESEDAVDDLIQFSRTTKSFRALMAGETDLLVVAEPNAAVFDEMAEAGFEAEMTPFATDALVFVVNADNPVDSLTVEQLRDIYAGKITNWSEVGGDDLPIIPFQRNAEAGSQVMMEKLLMDGTPLMEPPANYVVHSMEGLMQAVRAYDNSPGAIGYSVYYYANDMEMAEGLKIIAVNDVKPTADTIRDSSYPFRNPYFVVMAKDTPADSMTRVLYDWILGKDGQMLANKLGYVAVMGAAE